MKLILLLHIFLMMPLCSLISQVSELEYFIDDDPGVGKAIKVNSNDINNLSFDINKNDYKEGFHLLGVRAKNSLNNWSANTYYHFYILNDVNNNSKLLISNCDTIIKEYKLEKIRGASDSCFDLLITKSSLSDAFNNIQFTITNSRLANQTYDLLYYNQIDKRVGLKDISLSYSLVKDSANPMAFATYKLLKDNSLKDNEYSFEINNPQTNETDYLFSYLLVDSSRTISHYRTDTLLLDKDINRLSSIGENYLIIQSNNIKINRKDNIDCSMIDIISIRGETMLKHCLVYKDYIDTSALPKGLYLLVIKKNDCIYSRRFLK